VGDDLRNGLEIKAWNYWQARPTDQAAGCRECRVERNG